MSRHSKEEFTGGKEVSLPPQAMAAQRRLNHAANNW